MREITECEKKRENKRKRGTSMLSTEETQQTHRPALTPGDLVRFKFLEGEIAGNIHNMSESVGIVVEVTDLSCRVCVGDEVFDACWVVEVVRSV